MTFLRTVAAVICSASLVASIARADETVRIVVEKPTVIAFFEPVSEAQLENDLDTSAALDDFQFYAQEIRKALDGSEVAFHEIYVREFTVVVDGAEKLFQPEVAVGYYFVAPGRAARVEYGVHTDEDVLALVGELCGSRARPRGERD